MNKFNSPLLLFFCVFIAGCFSQPELEIPEEIATLENLTFFPADTEPLFTIDFEPVATFGDAEDVIIGNLVNSVVDDDGRVFLADGSENTIHVFNPDGSYIQNIGREGEGPGEFGGIGSIKTSADYLYAMDWNQSRLNAFSLQDLSFAYSVNLMREGQNPEELSGAFPGEFNIRSDGTFLMSYNMPFMRDNMDEERNILYYAIDTDGRIVSEQILNQKAGDFLYDQSDSGFMVLFSPFGGRPLISVAKDDRIMTAWTEDFLIKFHNPDGSYEKAIYYPYRKAALDREKVINQYEEEEMRRIVRNADAPDTWPALNSMIVDDENRLWISTIVDDDEVYEWWLLDEDGELLARYTWPRTSMVNTVKNGTLYARETDEETGLQEIVKYRIEFI